MSATSAGSGGSGTSTAAEEILAALGGLIVHHEEIDSIFRAAIGDYGYLVRSKDLDEVRAAARYIQETA